MSYQEDPTRDPEMPQKLDVDCELEKRLAELVKQKEDAKEARIKQLEEALGKAERFHSEVISYLIGYAASGDLRKFVYNPGMFGLKIEDIEKKALAALSQIPASETNIVSKTETTLSPETVTLKWETVRKIDAVLSDLDCWSGPREALALLRSEAGTEVGG